MDSLLPSKPSTYSQLIHRSLYLYRRSFSKIILLACLMSIVVFIPRLLSDFIGQDIFTYLEPLSFHRLWLLAIDFIAFIFFIAIIWHTFCAMRGKKEPFIADIRIGLRKVWYVFVAALLQSAIMFAISIIIYGLLILLNQLPILFVNSLAGILLTTCIFVGQLAVLLYVSTLFVFTIPLIAIENKGILNSIETSMSLVWKRWWRVFSTQITPWLYYVATLFVIKYLLQIDLHIYFTNKTNGALWITIMHIILFSLFIPWTAALLVTQLKDLELRKELAPAKRAKKRKK